MASYFPSTESLFEWEKCASVPGGTVGMVPLRQLPPSTEDSSVSLTTGSRRTTTLCSECGVGRSERCGQQAELFCDTHEVLICKACSSDTHLYCVRKILHDAEQEGATRLTKRYKDLMVKIEEKRREDAEVTTQVNKLSEHLKEVEDDILNFSEEVESGIREGLRADSKRIIEDMQFNLSKLSKEAEKESQRNQELTQIRLARLREVTAKVDALVMRVRTNHQKCFDAAQEAKEVAENVLFADDISLKLKEGRAAERKCLEAFSAPTHANALDLAQRIAQGVRLEKSGGRDAAGAEAARVEGLSWRLWYLSDTVTAPKPIKRPRVKIIDDHQVVILDPGSATKPVYSVNLEKKSTTQVAEGVSDLSVLSDGSIACRIGEGIGNFTSQWQRQQDVAVQTADKIPTASHKFLVGNDRKYLINLDETRIGIINGEGTMMHIINTKVCINDLVGPLHSGDTVVKNRRNKFVLLDEAGARKGQIQGENWFIADAAVDRTSGSIYIVYSDKIRREIRVCRPTAEGAIEEEELIISHKELDPHCNSHLAVFGSKMLCICNGNKLLVFKLSTDACLLS